MTKPCSPHYCLWCNLPQLAFYKILECLDSLADIDAVLKVCSSWHFLADREAFWSSYLVRTHPNYRRTDPLPPMAQTRQQLARIIDEARPDRLESECCEHKDEVLHVATPDCPAGKFFATASKDGTLKLWNLSNPSVCYRTLHFNKESLVASLPTGSSGPELHRLELVSQFDWLYCQYVEFQPFISNSGDDSVILISGVKREAERGDIAIYSIALDRFLSRARLQPYDVFGCFLDSYHFLSGTFEHNHHNNTSVNRVHIFRINPLTSNGDLLLELHSTPESAVLHTFTGHPNATVRRLMVAQGGRMCLGSPTHCRFNNGAVVGRYQSETSRLQYQFESAKLRDTASQSDPAAPDLRNPLDCRCREKLLLVNRGRSSFLSECVCVRRLRHCRPPWIDAYERHLESFHGPDRLDDDPNSDPCRWSSRSIYSMPAGVAHINEAGDSHASPDDWEVSVDGHVIGMSLSPDHRFLFVNVRPFRDVRRAAVEAPPGIGIVDVGDAEPEPLELRESAEIHVLDLLAWRHYRAVYTGHKGYTPSAQCFFLFMDVGSLLVCSGSEDGQAYIWDRLYGTKLCTLSHDSVVNACALSTCGLVITVSDDQCVKVWSTPRSRLRRLQQQQQQQQQQRLSTRSSTRRTNALR